MKKIVYIFLAVLLAIGQIDARGGGGGHGGGGRGGFGGGRGGFGGRSRSVSRGFAGRTIGGGARFAGRTARLGAGIGAGTGRALTGRSTRSLTGRQAFNRRGVAGRPAGSRVGPAGRRSLAGRAALAGGAGALAGAAAGRAASRGAGTRALNRSNINNAASRAGIKSPTAAQRNTLNRDPRARSLTNRANRARNNARVNRAMNRGLNNRHFNRFARNARGWWNRFGWWGGWPFFDFGLWWDAFWFSPFLIFPWWYWNDFYSNLPSEYPWYEPEYWDYDPDANEIKTSYLDNDDYAGAISNIEQKLGDLQAKIDDIGMNDDLKYGVNKIGWLALDIKHQIEESKTIDEQEKEDLENRIDTEMEKVQDYIAQNEEKIGSTHTENTEENVPTKKVGKLSSQETEDIPVMEVE